MKNSGDESSADPRELLSRLSARAERTLRRHPRWGFPVALLRDVLYRQGVAQIGLSAAGVAFWFVIAAFPGLIASVSLLGLFLEPRQIEEIIGQLDGLAPGSLGAALLQQVQSAALSEPSTLSLSFAVSLAVSAWSASAGVYNLSRGVRLAYGLPHHQYLVARLRALVGSFTIIAALALITIAVAVVSAWASAQSGALAFAAYAIVTVLAFGLLLGIMAALFAFAIGGTQPRPAVLPGAILAALGVVGVYVGLGIALSFLTRYEAVYGALAGTITVMLVLYIASYIILIGALTNGQWRAVRSAQSAGRAASSSPA